MCRQSVEELGIKERQAEQYKSIIDKRLKKKGDSGKNLLADVVAGMAAQIAAQRAALTLDVQVKEAMLIV